MHNKTNTKAVQIEIEKKYSLTDNDYSIIKKKTKFISNENIKDYFLDKDLILAKNGYFLRLRNGVYELKICTINKKTDIHSCEEYDNEDEINEKIKQFGITTDDVIGICFIDTHREKYEYLFNDQKITIDVDRYQYGKRYELEILFEDKGYINREKIEIELTAIIEDFRKKLGLTAESDNESYKIVQCAMHQNIDFYEIISE